MDDRIYKNMAQTMKLYSEVFENMRPAIESFNEMSNSLNKYMVPILRTYSQIDYNGISRIAESMRPILSIYSNYDYMNTLAEAARTISISAATLAHQMSEMQVNIPDMSHLNSMIKDLAPITQNYSSIALNLQRALSEWKYEDLDVYEHEFDDIPEELEEAVKAVCNGEATKEQVRKYGEKWQDKIKKIISTIFSYIILSLALPSLYDYAITPVYKSVKDIILYRDQGNKSVEEKIEADTELEVWSDDLNQDYIEISYCQDGETISGYIKKSDLDENTIKVSEGVNIDEVMFVSHCTSLMAEYWKMDESDAYKKLNEETDIIQGFVIRNYDALSKMDDKDIVAEILKEYDKRSQEKVEVSENKKKINYTVVCVNEFANKFNIASKEAFIYLYDHKGIEFIKEHYDIEHTLSLDDAVEDITMVCRNNGGGY